MKETKFERRKRAVRSKIKSQDLARLVVFRSQKYIYGQIIDKRGKVLAFASDVNKKLQSGKATKLERAKIVGQELGKKALAGKIVRVVFDRGAYKYHGRVKSLAEGAKEAGLKF